jgi:hypothetical protein
MGRPWMSTDEGGALLEMVLRSFRDRRALCGVVLATFRVELTHQLTRMAEGCVVEADLDRVFEIASQIASAAAAAKLPLVSMDARALEHLVAAAHLGGRRQESEMLAAGLKVIEQILAATTERQVSDDVRARRLLN